jgi:hypothetical protein
MHFGIGWEDNKMVKSETKQNLSLKNKLFNILNRRLTRGGIR